MNAMNKPVKIVLVTGYLGAGKTTLLNHVLANGDGVRAAVIVNDIGEVNIDAALLANGSSVAVENVIPLTNGCICCTLSDDLASQLGDLAGTGDYDYIVIEASGICEPMPIAYTISQFCAGGEGDASDSFQGALLELDNIVAVVDCARMVDEFDAGRDLLADGLDEDDVASLLIEQLEFCTTVVLNKTDLVGAEDVAAMRAIVRSLQKDAVIIEASEGRVSLSDIFDTGRFNFDAVYQSAGWLDMLQHAGHHHDDPEVLEYGISTFVYERSRPFNLEAFSLFVKAMPREVVRCKGITWIAEQPGTCFIFEQAGRQLKFTDNGPFEGNPAFAEPLTKLVFIGRDMDRAAIEQSLDSCL